MRYRSVMWFSAFVSLATFAGCGGETNDDIPIVDFEDSSNNGGSSNDDGSDANNGSNNGPASNNDSGSNNGAANNGAANNGAANNGAANNGGMTVSAPEVDPECIDGRYTELLPDPTADISAPVAAYQPSALHDFYDEVLHTRYPFGATLVDGGLALFDCVSAFSGQPGAAESALARLDVVVHECGHAHDLSQGFGTYSINSAQTLNCSVGRATFARSLIGEDEFQDQRPPCAAPLGCDRYFDTYLQGRGSDQGFDMVLEETVQYVNSLATAYAFHDFGRASVSARDGLLTFLWYLQRYLRMARLEYPDDYAKLTDDCWREAILTVWGRAWWILQATEEIDRLGIDDAALLELVRDPQLLGEIDRLRELEGCP